MSTLKMKPYVINQDEWNLPPFILEPEIQTTCDQFTIDETKGGIKQTVLRLGPDEAYELICQMKIFLEGYVGADVKAKMKELIRPEQPE